MDLKPLTPDFIHGAYSIEQGEGWIRPWRLDHAQRGLYGNQAVVDNAGRASAVRVAFTSRASAIDLAVEPHGEERPVDLCMDGEVIAELAIPAGAGHLHIDGLPGDEGPHSLWFGGQPLRLRGISAMADPLPADGLRWLHYGSSISQGGCASRPCRTWVSRVARATGWNLTNLGFGGNCHMEPTVAMSLRDFAADLITLKLGINICNQKSLSFRTFTPATMGLVRLIRERHPQTPIALISPIFCPHRERVDFGDWLNLEQMRASHVEVVQRLREHGDERICYVDGLELFGEGQGHLLPDDLHPDDDGHAHIAARFCELVVPRLLELRG